MRTTLTPLSARNSSLFPLLVIFTIYTMKALQRIGSACNLEAFFRETAKVFFNRPFLIKKCSEILYIYTGCLRNDRKSVL